MCKNMQNVGSLTIIGLEYYNVASNYVLSSRLASGEACQYNLIINWQQKLNRVFHIIH